MRTTATSIAAVVAAVHLASCSSFPIVTSSKVAAGTSSGMLTYALPKTRSQFELKKATAADKSVSYDLAYTGELVEPDPNGVFSIAYGSSPFAEDIVKVVTTSEGFLSTVDVTNEDKTGAFLIQLGELAKQGAKAARSFDKADTGAAEEIVLAKLVVDVTDAGEIDGLNTYLAGAKTGISVSVSGPSIAAVGTTPPSATCSHSICFRPKLPYQVTINGRANRRVQHTILSPNRASVVALNIERANFVKKVTNITFDKGSITSVSINKPSEALAVVSIPVEILKAIVSIPTELIQLKIDTTSKEKDLLGAQKQLIEAQQALIKAQKAADSPPAQETP